MSTTAEAAVAQPTYECFGRPVAIFNPHGKPIEELPVIMGFNNGGPAGLLSAVAIAEDGNCLGGHCCSAEDYMPWDLGIVDGTREDRHEGPYREHYPGGYRMEFVPRASIKRHTKTQEALRLNALLAKRGKPTEPVAE